MNFYKFLMSLKGHFGKELFNLSAINFNLY